MDRDQRTETIKISPESGSTARLWVLGDWQDLTVLTVPVEALVLNIDNRRFSAERQLFERQLGHSLDPENSETDAFSVEAILLDRDLQVDGDRVVGKSGKDYIALRKDWQRRQQESPFWIRPDGTVRNGNRRLAMLRRIRREEGMAGYERVDAVVLDHNAIDELAMFAMEQREQLTEDYKVRYTDINLLLAIKDAADDLEIDWFDHGNIERVAGELQHVMRNDPGYATVQLYAIKYMTEYLEDLGQPGRYDKLIGQIERFRDVGRIMRRVEDEDSFRAPAMLNILFAAVSAGLTHLQIREIRTIYREAVDSFDTLAAAVADIEEEWTQRSADDLLGDPEEVDVEPDNPDSFEDVLDPPGPVVTNYPSDEVSTLMLDAFDQHRALHNEDLLKIVKEINHRLAALKEATHLSEALSQNEQLRAELDTTLQWFDDHQTALR